VSAFPGFGSQLPPSDPASLVRGILAQPRFRIQAAAPSGDTWWDILSRWLSDRWGKLMDAFSHNVHLGPGISAAIGDLLLIALVAVVIIVGVRLLLGMARESAASAALSASALPEHADARELYEAAQRAAQAGAYAIAIALVFRATLAALDALGALRDDPARTVNECRRDVRVRASRLSASFETIARAFTAAVYAEEGVTSELWRDVEIAYRAFRTVQTDAA
jgi:predicted lipid-binding transport protein (Tim44 family)